jgi:hypothetical protein
LFLFFSGTFLGVRYVVVLSCEIEDQQELAETIGAIRDAEIPHLEGDVHLGIHEVADRILAEFRS